MNASSNSSPATTLSDRLVKPFRDFMEKQTSGGLLLLGCTVLAMLWANSPWASAYHALWHIPMGLSFGQLGLEKSLHHWINDGLMAVFLFLVGLEIKREVLIGELSSPRQAALPIAAAIGGMVAPAMIYALFNYGGPGSAGWGVPMATDIAFALGVLALLGDRVPLSLRIFLAALAIVDDLGAVLIIALFYTAELSIPALAVAAALVVLLVLLNRSGVRHALPYLIVGAVLWVAVLKSGIHATIAGVLLAMTIPNSSGTAGNVEDSLLVKLEHTLHPWVMFAIMPIFAFANAGVTLGDGIADALVSHVTLGVAIGLVIGKLIGVFLFSWLAVRTGMAVLPRGVSWMHIHGVAWLAGIGFTMALFIANLAFTDPTLLNHTKVGILGASIIAGVVGYLLLRNVRPTAEAS